MKEQLKTLKEHILVGTFHVIPFIVAGGVLFSLTIMLNPAGAATPEVDWLVDLTQTGLGGLTLFVPVLGGYIACSIADKPGLAPDMIEAYLAKETGARFPGGMAAGLVAGVIVREPKGTKLPISPKTLGFIFIYPLVDALITGGIIVWGIGGPATAIMNRLANWLFSPGDVDEVPLASILRVMTALGVDGPANRIAALLAQTRVGMSLYLMGDAGAAICTPPIDMDIVTLLASKKYNTKGKEAGKATILMGCVGITGGAILFMANDPSRTVLSLIVGAVVGNIVPFLAGVLSHAPWGGPVMFPVMEDRIWYFTAVPTDKFVAALTVNLLKKSYVEEPAGNDANLDDLDEITFDGL